MRTLITKKTLLAALNVAGLVALLGYTSAVGGATGAEDYTKMPIKIGENGAIACPTTVEDGVNHTYIRRLKSARANADSMKNSFSSKKYLREDQEEQQGYMEKFNCVRLEPGLIVLPDTKLPVEDSRRDNTGNWQAGVDFDYVPILVNGKGMMVHDEDVDRDTLRAYHDAKRRHDDN